MKRTQASEYFPKNYIESRKRFIADAQKLGSTCALGRWLVPSNLDADLTVDYVWLPPLKEPETLVVLLSGIHGSETYAGSAILNLFMNEILPQTRREKLGVLMVHAMNPYGFKYHQRYTENHVNLNRNFSVSGGLFKSKNPDSIKMHNLFYTRGPVQTLEGKLIQSLRHEKDKIFFGDISVDQLTKAISPGQFENPEYVEYGGQQAEPQTKALMEYVRHIMPSYKNVISLDLHTGLGDRGRLHLLTDGLTKSMSSDLFNQILRPDEDKDFYVFTPPQTEGFYKVYGATNSLFGDLATESQKVCAITLEFGTLGHSLDQQVRDINTCLVEHQGHVFGYINDEVKKQVRDLNFERSYPDNEAWRADVLRAAEGMLTRIFYRL